MDEKEIQALLAKVGTEAKSAVQVQLDAMKTAGTLIDKSAVELLIKAAITEPEDTTAQKAEIVLMKKSIEDQANEIKSLKENPTPKPLTGMGFKAAFFAACEAKKTELELMHKNWSRSMAPLVLEIKAATMSDASTIDAGATAISLTDNTGIISPIRQRTEKYLSGASVGSCSGNHAMWIEETTQSGTPIFVAESGGATQLSVLYVEKTANVRDIPVYGKLTQNMLADLPQLYSYVVNNLGKRLGIAIENGLLLGDGTGVTLFGLSSYATAFSAGNAALQVEFANYIDVVENANKQVTLAYGIPNRWYIHPDDMFILKAAKDKVGRPLWKDYMNNDGDVVIGGALLVVTPAQTAGAFQGGDTKSANVLFRDSVSIQLGLDGNDFINQMKTLLLSQRLVQFVSANDTPVIVKGTWAAAVVALNQP